MSWLLSAEESSKLPLHVNDKLLTAAGQVLNVLSVYNGEVMLQPAGMGDTFTIPVADALKLEKAPAFPAVQAKHWLKADTVVVINNVPAPAPVQSPTQSPTQSTVPVVPQEETAGAPFSIRIPDGRMVNDQTQEFTDKFSVAMEVDKETNELLFDIKPDMKMIAEQWLRDNGIAYKPDVKED